MNLRVATALAGVDGRAIRRDSLLRLFVLFPFLIGLMMRWLIPTVQRLYGHLFDLEPYYELIAAFFGLLIMPGLAGTLIGLLLLDEKDAGTLVALRVTPLSMERYLAYRLAVPAAISVVSTYIVLALLDILPVPYVKLLPLAVVAALSAPIYALLLAAFANNKVQGLALMKGMGIFYIAPIAAWFVPEPWQWLLGVMPTYWPVKAFWQLTDGQAYWPALVLGTAVAALYLWAFLRRFKRAIG